MNNEQHVGEILYAQHTEQAIEYQDHDTKWEILKEPVSLTLLLDSPERYRIKEEPKFTYVNILQGAQGPFASCFQIKDDAENHNHHHKMLVRAHPIELPS